VRSTAADPSVGRMSLPAFAVSYAALSALSIVAARAFGDIAQIGIAEAVAIVLIQRGLLFAPTHGLQLRGALAAIAVLGVAVPLLLGAPLMEALVWAVAHVVLVAVALAVLTRLQATVLRQSVLATVLLPVLVTAFVAGPLAAGAAATLATALGLAPVGAVFLDAWFGHTIGAFIAMPVLIAVFVEKQMGTPLRADAWIAQAALGTLALASVVASGFLIEFPFIAISCTLLIVAVIGRLLTNAVVCMAALAWLTLLPTSEGLRPALIELASVFNGLGLGQRLAYGGLSVLPPLAIAALLIDLQRARLRLAAERRRLHAIADNVPALIAHLDSGLRYRFVNRSYEQWWGVKPSEVLGRTPDEVLPPELAQIAMPLLRKALTGTAQQAEFELGPRAISATYLPASDFGGLTGVLVLATDVTEQKALQRRLTEEKQIAQVTLSSIGDAVITVDAALRVTYLNPIAEQMLGCRCTEAIGLPVGEVLVLRDDEGEPLGRGPLELAIRENRIVGLSMDASLVSTDGTVYAIEDSAAPIHGEDGIVVGAVMVFHDVSESRALGLRMAHLAQHDALTGLPNRLLLQDRLERTLADGRTPRLGALMFLDLDRFKHINDSLGHPVGDLVLQEVARRLERAVRTIDTVSRQGGDEFVVLLPQLRYARDAARVAEKLMHALEEPIEVEEHLLHVGVTIGIALFPADGSDADTVVRHADIALYQGKGEGRGRYRFYDPAMSERAELRLHVENELRGALRTGQFELVYQPKYDAGSGALVSAEALLRWRRGERLEAPEAFLQIAEDSGLIPELEAWAIEQACTTAMRWRRDGLGEFPIAVNTAFALHRPDAFVALVRGALARSGLPADQLVLEIEERQLAFDGDSKANALHELAGMGVRIAVDDFGAEYSSLRYLQHFPFHELKIDRSFVDALADGERGAAMVAAIVAVARALGTRVVAEGVETAHERERLVELGCDQLQGYLFAPPLSEARFRELVRAQAGNAGVP
jgi:diguanylate cyclase (GGDEF)-like protein/PAS domain S-box-containing protein